jgi:hypothetical protein
MESNDELTFYKFWKMSYVSSLNFHNRHNYGEETDIMEPVQGHAPPGKFWKLESLKAISPILETRFCAWSLWDMKKKC